MDTKDVIVLPREVVLELVELAEDALFVHETEYSNKVTEDDRVLMCGVWRALGKPVPGWFARKGWRVEEEE